jgi:hypothetical protein
VDGHGCCVGVEMWYRRLVIERNLTLKMLSKTTLPCAKGSYETAYN